MLKQLHPDLCNLKRKDSDRYVHWDTTNVLGNTGVVRALKPYNKINPGHGRLHQKGSIKFD